MRGTRCRLSGGFFEEMNMTKREKASDAYYTLLGASFVLTRHPKLGIPWFSKVRQEPELTSGVSENVQQAYQDYLASPNKPKLC